MTTSKKAFSRVLQGPQTADYSLNPRGCHPESSSTRGVLAVNSIIYIVGLVVVVVAVLSFFGLR
jgi:hypothetical protein